MYLLWKSLITDLKIILEKKGKKVNKEEKEEMSDSDDFNDSFLED